MVSFDIHDRSQPYLFAVASRSSQAHARRCGRQTIAHLDPAQLLECLPIIGHVYSIHALAFAADHLTYHRSRTGKSVCNLYECLYIVGELVDNLLNELLRQLGDRGVSHGCWLKTPKIVDPRHPLLYQYQ